MWVRWMKFNAVGLLGIAVQLGSLWILVELGRLRPLPAAAMATELAVLHNFLWHTRWTWADRPGSIGESLERLLKFNLTNGAVSLAGNLIVMTALTGLAHVPYLASNMIAIAVCSLANFSLSENWVFDAE